GAGLGGGVRALRYVFRQEARADEVLAGLVASFVSFVSLRGVVPAAAGFFLFTFYHPRCHFCSVMSFLLCDVISALLRRARVLLSKVGYPCCTLLGCFPLLVGYGFVRSCTYSSSSVHPSVCLRVRLCE
ncbi:unnamed protein product, partial [Ectocarpus fasciculatus]